MLHRGSPSNVTYDKMDKTKKIDLWVCARFPRRTDWED